MRGFGTCATSKGVYKCRIAAAVAPLLIHEHSPGLRCAMWVTLGFNVLGGFLASISLALCSGLSWLLSRTFRGWRFKQVFGPGVGERGRWLAILALVLAAAGMSRAHSETNGTIKLY